MTSDGSHFLMKCGLRCWKFLDNVIQHRQLQKDKHSKQHSKLSEHCVLTTVGQRESNRDKNSFRTTFFYPIIDLMLSEINRRFSKTNCDTMNSIQALNPPKDTVLNETELFSFAWLYDSNIDDLGHELHQFSRILDRKIQTGMQRPPSTVELVQFIEPYKDVFLSSTGFAK